jgi:hypothetical protein
MLVRIPGGKNPNKLVQPLCKSVWRFLKKLKKDLLYDPAIPLLGRYTYYTNIQERYLSSHVYFILFTIAKL